MAKRTLRSVCLLLFCAPVLLAPAGLLRAASVKKEMKFAVELAEKGLWNEAEHRFVNLLKRAPTNPRLWNDLAVAYEAMGRYEEAREAYNKAVKMTVRPPDGIIANHEAFEAFYETYLDPSTVQPPPLDDPRNAAIPPPPDLPGPAGEDEVSGDAAPLAAPRDPLRPVFPDEAGAPAEEPVETLDSPPIDAPPGGQDETAARPEPEPEQAAVDESGDQKAAPDDDADQGADNDAPPPDPEPRT